MPSALVAGGAGFIGSHLCHTLIDRGFRVACVDSLTTGSERNIGELRADERFSFTQQDISEPIPIAENFDFIFHLASPASVPDYLARPILTLDVNSLGTRNLLEMARECNARFLYASTSEIYGDPLVHPQPESYWGNVNPNGVRSCYDEGKRFGEAITMAYGRSYGLDVRIVRIFNTYGPRSRPDDGRIVPNFVTQALRGQPITIYGDGRQTRSFCYVSDMVEGLLAVMLTEDLKGEVFNIGNPDEYSVGELAEFINREVAAGSEFVYRPLPPDDPARRCPDISKARSTLGWQPHVKLDDGISRTIEWFRELLEIPQPVG